MSKELTEQWREGKLPQGWYYMIDCTGKEWFRYLSGVKPDADFVKCFKEVLAPVPDYHDLCELKQELEICKDEKADLYAKLCNALMQLESRNDQFVELTEKVGKLSSENGRLKYDNDVLSTVNDELIEKVERLEKQLEITTNALKEYERCENGSYANKALALIKEVK